MKTFQYFFLTLCLPVALVSCGGGGVSEDFTREINEVETAWNNASGSFTTAIDSVKQAKAGWENMSTNMVLPDSVKSTITPAYNNKLDSVKAICATHGQAYDGLLKDLETAQNTWNTDTKVFADWKDKVFKSEIDIETARKDLKTYQEKIKTTTGTTNEVNARLNTIRENCAVTCKAYESMVASAPKQEEPRGRRR